MQTQLQLPPSGRDFEVYRLVKVEQRSTRAVAETMALSQTRVCQLLERVGAFLTDVAPAAEVEERRGQRLHVAEQVAAERIDYLYSRAVRDYRQSKGEEKTVREVENGMRPKVTITTTRKSHGDGRLLMTAAKLVKLSAKLPLPMLGIGGQMEAEDLQAEDLAASVISSEEASPPEEDCSVQAVEQGDVASDLLNKDTTTPLTEINYMNEVLAKMRVNECRSAPVQPAVSPEPIAAESQPKTGEKRSAGDLKARKAFLAQAP